MASGNHATRGMVKLARSATPVARRQGPLLLPLLGQLASWLGSCSPRQRRLLRRQESPRDGRVVRQLSVERERHSVLTGFGGTALPERDRCGAATPVVATECSGR
jgi:hypothetical protein